MPNDEKNHANLEANVIYINNTLNIAPSSAIFINLGSILIYKENTILYPGKYENTTNQPLEITNPEILYHNYNSTNSDLIGNSSDFNDFIY